MTETYDFQTNVGDNVVWVTAEITPPLPATQYCPPEYCGAEITEVLLMQADADAPGGYKTLGELQTEELFIREWAKATPRPVDEILAQKAIEKWELDL